ncbi:MAG: CvpA family protein [Phycisphaerales bacterium]|nr:CvpA family protein [Phycisphaerales bacterium]
MMNILVIVIVLAMGYMGVIKKFFSSLLHMACVVVAGAIAFAFWEPASYLILEKAPVRGFFEFVEYSAWAIGLVVPFAVSLAILRVASDKLAPHNAIAANVPDAVGGGICGAMSGVVAAGILVIAVGTMRFKPSDFGYEPVKYQGFSLQRTGGLIFPVDRLVGGFYATASEATFATRTPLARWRPEPWHAAEVMRFTDKGVGRNTAKPGDFSLAARYRVKAAEGENLLQDRWANRPHDAQMLGGDKYPADARIEAVILDLKATMRERGSSFIAMTEGQVWMVAEDAQTGERLNLHPVAVIANPQGAETSLARFPYESPNFAIASAGAAALPWAFEFIVPNRFQPIACYVRNIRRELAPGQPVTEFDSVADRDDAITNGSLIAGAESIPDNYGREDQRASNDNDESEYEQAGIRATNLIPERTTIQKGSHKSLKIDDANHILEGDNAWTPTELSVRIVDRALRIDKFGVSGDVVMVQVDLGGDKKGSMYGQAMAAVQRVLPPQLVDVNGIRYEAVGWFYADRDKVEIRYTPGETVRALSVLADNGIVMSAGRNDQKLTLLFICTYGTKIKSFNVGETEVFSLSEPLPLEKKQD